MADPITVSATKVFVCGLNVYSKLWIANCVHRFDNIMTKSKVYKNLIGNNLRAVSFSVSGKEFDIFFKIWCCHANLMFCFGPYLFHKNSSFVIWLGRNCINK